MGARARLAPGVEALRRRFAVDTGVEVELPARSRRRVPTDPAARREHMRRWDARVAAAIGLDVPDVATEDHVVPVPGHPDARLRVYWPTAERPPAAKTGPLPILVHFYGGSFTMGGIDWEGIDATCRVRAAEAGIVVVAGEYSLAPEVRYPAQPEQCWTVLQWTIAHAAALGADASRVAVGGASAGGNLAAASALMHRDRGGQPLRLQLLEVPALDLTGGHVDPRAISPVLPGAILRRISRPIVVDYLGPRGTRAIARRPYASPLLADDLSGLPPALILTAECDPLRGDGEAYARRLWAAGVPATCVRYAGQDHGSAGLRRLNPVAEDVHRQVVATLGSLHDAPVSAPVGQP